MKSSLSIFFLFFLLSFSYGYAQQSIPIIGKKQTPQSANPSPSSKPSEHQHNGLPAQDHKRTCGSTDYLNMQLAQDPTLAARRESMEDRIRQALPQSGVQLKDGRAQYTIPVVVHVVYKNATENISAAQIQSQINILNQDFQKLNADVSQTPGVWSALTADVGIEFCLAQRDPNGNATNGITRTSTSVQSFSLNNEVKFSSQGGINAWDADQYLNIWVCDLGGGLLGYAQFPGGPNATDGVVIGYEHFGNTGTATAPYNKGRTATHEVGHWLNLYHIWGDEPQCALDDNVTDTPQQKDSNGGCPTFPLTSGPGASCSGSNGAMFMNYMDYVVDACMFMFTTGQKTRMVSALTNDRASLLNSQGCVPPGGGTATCDTISNYGGNSTGSLYTPVDVGSAGTGYISGTNSYLDVAKADKYSNYPAGYRVNGAYLGFAYAYALSGNNTITVRVWNSAGAGGTPGSVLGSQTLNYSTIVNNINAQQASYVSFATPIVVSGAYYLGIEFNPSSGDTIALITNQDGQTVPGTAWEKWSDNSWHNYNESPASWGVDVAHFIFPVMCSTSITVQEEPAESTKFSVFPNPSSDEVFLGWDNNRMEPVRVKILNSLGQVVSTNAINQGGNSFRIDVSEMSSGYYFVEMQLSSGVSVYEKIQIRSTK
jgi:hypothetical protein